MAKPRFKIDLSEYSSDRHFQLYFWEKKPWQRGRWRTVGSSYPTVAEVKALYEIVKDLPEYLP